MRRVKVCKRKHKISKIQDLTWLIAWLRSFPIEKLAKPSWCRSVVGAKPTNPCTHNHNGIRKGVFRGCFEGAVCRIGPTLLQGASGTKTNRDPLVIDNRIVRVFESGKRVQSSPGNMFLKAIWFLLLSTLF